MPASPSTASPQLRASEIAREFGFTARHWVRLAAAGKIPGAWQRCPGSGWLFDRRQFIAWREAAKRRAVQWQPSIAEEKGIGPAPSVKGGNTGTPSKPTIEQLLNDVLGNGSTSSTRSPTAKSRGGPGRRRPQSSSGSTSPRLSVVRRYRVSLKHLNEHFAGKMLHQHHQRGNVGVRDQAATCRRLDVDHPPGYGVPVLAADIRAGLGVDRGQPGPSLPAPPRQRGLKEGVARTRYLTEEEERRLLEGGDAGGARSHGAGGRYRPPK